KLAIVAHTRNAAGFKVADSAVAASSLFHEFRLLALRPRVVVEREGDALAQRRVAVEPELDESTWAGVGQVNFAEDLKGSRRHLLRVRHDAVYDLQSVDIGLVLLIPAEAVDDRRGEEREQGEEEQQN